MSKQSRIWDFVDTRTHLTFSAGAHFLKSGGKLYEIPPQSRYSRFAKLCDSNGL